MHAPCHSQLLLLRDLGVLLRGVLGENVFHSRGACRRLVVARTVEGARLVGLLDIGRIGDVVDNHVVVVAEECPYVFDLVCDADRSELVGIPAQVHTVIRLQSVNTSPDGTTVGICLEHVDSEQPQGIRKQR